MTKRTHRIAKLRIGEISMVDEGDNPGAGVIIMKRRGDTALLKQRLTEVMEAAGELTDLAAGSGGMTGVEKATRILGDMDMDIEQLSAKVEQFEADLDTVTKAKDAAEGQVAELTGKVAELTAELEKAKAGKADDGGDDDVLKSLPEPIRKRLEAAEQKADAAAAEIEKARDEGELNARISKARELGVADPDAIGGLLHRIAKGKATAADADKVVEVLTVAKNVADAEGRLFKALGKSSDDAAGTDAQAKLDAAIDSIQKAKPALSREAAYAEAIEANPALYDEIVKIKPSA